MPTYLIVLIAAAVLAALAPLGYLLYQIGAGPLMGFRRAIEVKTRPYSTTEAVIVFLNGGLTDEGRLDPVSIPALRKAAYLLANGYAPRIIIGRAPGLPRPGPVLRNAVEWLQAAGVGPDLIMVQDTSGTGLEGMQRIIALCKAEGWESATLVGPEHQLGRLAAPWRRSGINLYPISVPFDDKQLNPQTQAALLGGELACRLAPWYAAIRTRRLVNAAAARTRMERKAKPAASKADSMADAEQEQDQITEKVDAEGGAGL